MPAGTYTYAVTAVFEGWTARSASSAAVSVTIANHLVFTTQPTGATGGATLGTQPVVAVQDNAMQHRHVRLQLRRDAGPHHAQRATLACGNNPKAVVSGVATFAGCKVDKAGHLHAHRHRRVPRLGGEQHLHDHGRRRHQVAFTTQPGGAGIPAALATQPAVTVQDAGATPSPATPAR